MLSQSIGDDGVSPESHVFVSRNREGNSVFSFGCGQTRGG